MKQSYAIKSVFALFLLLMAFHLSGVESAFCDDGLVTASAESHGCQVCQPGQHAVIVQSTVISRLEIPGVFVSSESLFLQPQEPTRLIFRPPIFA